MEKRYLSLPSSSLLIPPLKSFSLPNTTLSATESDLDDPSPPDPRIEFWGLGLGFRPSSSLRCCCCFLRLLERITTIGGGFFWSRRLRSWRYEPPEQSVIFCFDGGGLGEGEEGGFWRRRWRAKDLARVRTPSGEGEGEGETSIKDRASPWSLFFFMYFPIFRRVSWNTQREKRGEREEKRSDWS